MSPLSWHTSLPHMAHSMKWTQCQRNATNVRHPYIVTISSYLIELSLVDGPLYFRWVRNKELNGMEYTFFGGGGEGKLPFSGKCSEKFAILSLHSSVHYTDSHTRQPCSDAPWLSKVAGHSPPAPPPARSDITDPLCGRLGCWREIILNYIPSPYRKYF